MRAVLLTRDLDFADVRNYPPAQYNGMVVFRLTEDAIAKDIVRSSFFERLLSSTRLLGDWLSLSQTAFVSDHRCLS